MTKINNNASIKINSAINKMMSMGITMVIATSSLVGGLARPQAAMAKSAASVRQNAGPNVHSAARAAEVYSAYAVPAAKQAMPQADPASETMLPIEMLIGDNPANTTLFPNGFTKVVTVSVSNAASVTKFWLQAYSLSYQDKASVQINNSSWVTLNNTTTVVMQPGNRYGGIGGANRTLKLTFDVPPGVVVNGDNVIRFKFNKTDGESMGFRVLNFNLWNASNQFVLPNPPLPQEDPNTWLPPSSSPADIAEGETLWRSRNIMTNNPLDPSPFKASCADCHSQSGYDLKFFNFSNTSVIERARFHGLTTTQGQKIASFIRTLPFENPGRPWNPPYQPGPGLEAKPVDEWAAGAGIDAVLESDVSTQSFLPSNGGNPNDLIAGTRVKKFNVRDVPISIELPDWNHWLPRVHPIDSMGVITFENSPNFTFYDKIRKGLSGTLPGFTRDEYVFKQLRSDLDNWAYPFAPDSKSPEFAALGPSGNNSPFTKKQVVEQYAATIWSASKLFEIMHEFELEGMGRTFYGLQGESRQWLSNRHIFNFSPHLLGMSDSFPVTGDGQAKLTNLYFANVWYWLQIILNPGARNSITGGLSTNDWDYTATIMNNLAQESGGKEPLRSLLLTYKGMDSADNGYGPEGRDKGGANGAWWGWDMRDNTAQLLGDTRAGWWDSVSNKKPALTAAYQTWLQKSGSFSVERWRKLAATRDAPDFAFNLSSPPYTFVIPNFAANQDLENAATMLAYLTRIVRDQAVMDDVIRNSMADLGSLLWPSNPWNTLITRSGAAPSNLQATTGIEQVTLSWNALGGASSYNVKRSDFVTGTFVAVGLFVNGTSFVDKDLQAGRAFHYQVSANIGSTETNNSAAVSATPTFGLVGYWPLDGGSTITDASVTQNPALLIGTLSTVPGHTGNAIRLGPQSFVATERNLRWLASDFTFAAWVNTTATGNNDLTLAPALAGNAGEAEDNPLELYETSVHWRYDKVGNRFAIIGGLDASGRIGASFGTDPGAVVKSTQPINTGTWRHVVVSRNAASGLVKVYVDGALSASGTQATGDLYQRAFALGVPSNPTLPNFFPSPLALDEIKIFDSPLTDLEVLALYTEGETIPTATPTSTPAATATAIPTATPTSTPAATATAAPTATPTSTPAATATAAPTATPTSTPAATATAAPTATPTSTPEPTATPTPTLAPSATPAPGSVLDTFNRPGPALGPNWVGNGPIIVGNQLKGGLDDIIYWQQSFGTDQWASVKIVTLPDCRYLDLVLKATGSNHVNGLVDVSYNSCVNPKLTVYTFNPEINSWAVFNGSNTTFGPGDTLSARVQPNRLVTVYKNGAVVLSATLPTAYAGFDVSRAGQIGVATSGNDVILDDFDGGDFGVVVATATPTNTPVPTATPTSTATNTPAPTATPTSTATNTPVPTATPTSTATNTPVPTATPTTAPTNTPVPTTTPTSTATNTPAPTATPTSTATNTPVPTATPTSTATNTPVPTATPTSTATNTPVPTATPTSTATNTPAPTATPTSTATNTPVPTAMPTSTATNTPVPTATPTTAPTNTPAPTATPTAGTCSFPQAADLDNFNRANGIVGNGWVGEANQYYIQSNQLKAVIDASIFRPNTFGATQEARVQLMTALSSGQTFALLMKGTNNYWTNGVIEVNYTQGSGLRVYTYNGSAWVQHGSTVALSLAASDVLGARATASGSVQVYKNSSLVGTFNITGWSDFARVGQIGFWSNATSSKLFDNFGGGSVACN